VFSLPSYLRDRRSHNFRSDVLVLFETNADGKRAVIDGGFTRLFCKWDSAGTSRFVKNVAAWLYNFEGILERMQHAKT